MTAIVRRSIRATIPAAFVLCDADDLDGTQTSTYWMDVTGAQRALVIQGGTAGANGASGIDVIGESHDGGVSWLPCPTALTLAVSDSIGALLTNGVMNVAGAEAAAGAVGNIFKCGPFEGPTLLAVFRDTTGGAAAVLGTDWGTAAPQVIGIRIY
jgi:hypothetical protein